MQGVTNPDAQRRDVLDCRGTEQWNRGLAVQYELGSNAEGFMLVPALLGKIAFVLGFAALVAAFTKPAGTAQRVNTILLAGAILLGAMHYVITMSAMVESILAVCTLLLALAVVSRLLFPKAQ